jgi:alpha-methylacyl-CoA racemase
MMGTGPLKGVRIVEVAGIGPGPFAAMLLADLGADVLRVERMEGVAIMRQMGFDASRDVSNRSRSAIAVDLKNPEGVALVLELIDAADAVTEGFRPGVMERLGLGPEVCLARNRRLVYGRMTGWGQTGPLARAAGHDINYIALSGLLHTFAREGERPVPPGNAVGDMGGGGLLLAFGITCALLESRASGVGQVVDAAMFEGAASLGTSTYVTMAMGLYDPSRPGTNLSDTGAHFYEVYETQDRRHVAVGAIEPQFYAALVRGLGLELATLPKQMDQSSWREMKRRFAAIFRTKTRAEWDAVFADQDACVTPVLSPVEAAEHPHASYRGSFCSPGGVLQPSPVPRFSRTPGSVASGPAISGSHGDPALLSWGVNEARITQLRSSGALL